MLAHNSTTPLIIATSSVLQSSAGKHWRTERVVAVGLMALIPAGIVYPNPIIDYTLATLIPLHNHWYVERTPVGKWSWLSVSYLPP